MVRQAVVNIPGPQVHEEFVGIYIVPQTDGNYRMCSSGLTYSVG